eukprot:822873-Rhodomonas_salina.2
MMGGRARGDGREETERDGRRDREARDKGTTGEGEKWVKERERERERRDHGGRAKEERWMEERV